MSFQLKEIRGYLKRHNRFIPTLLRDICKLFFWKNSRKKIAVITTGSGGVGDYLWIRNYMPLIRQQGYKVILIAMAHWKEIVETFDIDNIDIIRYFESCQTPKKIETIFFKLFKADIFLNFRIESMGNYVKSHKEYNNNGISKDIFYEEKNNMVFSKFTNLSNGFRHRMPIIKPINNKLPRPFAIYTERGNTQGSLSLKQSIAIVETLTDNGYHILFNGDMQRLGAVVDTTTMEMIIDGSKYSFPQYTYLINKCAIVVTVNTSIYHFALQFDKPCVVISANEYETIKLDASKQIIIFNDELQRAYVNGGMKDYVKNDSIKLSDIECNRITVAINEGLKNLCQ